VVLISYPIAMVLLAVLAVAAAGRSREERSSGAR
jgi:hypothetical protein